MSIYIDRIWIMSFSSHSLSCGSLRVRCLCCVVISGTVAECQQERSQIKNKETAMTLLRAKLYSARLEEVTSKRYHARKLQVYSFIRFFIHLAWNQHWHYLLSEWTFLWMIHQYTFILNNMLGWIIHKKVNKIKIFILLAKYNLALPLK